MKPHEARRSPVTGRRALVTAGLASSFAVATGSRSDAVGRTGTPVSVLDLGATGDGVTDDTQAVRAAVAQAVAEGRSLVFPSGTYVVDAPIVVRDATSFVVEMHGMLKRKDQSNADAMIRFINCTNLVASSIRVDGNASRNGKVQSDGTWYPVDELKHDVRLDGCVGVWIGYLESRNTAADALYLSGGSYRCTDVKVEHINASSDGRTGRSVVSVIAGDNLQFGTVRARNVGCNVGVLVMPGGFQIEPNAGDTVSNVQVDNLMIHTAGAAGLGIWSPRGPYIRNVRVGAIRLHKLAGTHPNACDVNIRGVVGARIGHVDHTSDASNTNQVLSIDQCDDVEIAVSVPRVGTRPVNLGYSGPVTRLTLKGSLADSTSHLLQVFNLSDSLIDVRLRDCGTAAAYVLKNYAGTSARVRFRGDWRRGSRGAFCVSGPGAIEDWVLEDVDMRVWGRDTRIKQGGANSLHKIRKSRVEGLTTSTARPAFDTWGRGDFVENLAPAVLGTAGARYVVRGWLCTVAGYASQALWVECRMPTGT
jgi:hypothetical protein